MFKKYIDARYLYASLPWILILIGFGLLCITSFTEFTDLRWKEFLGSISKSILVGGVFSLLLKSMQFIGILRNELTNFIFEPKYLSNRKDLPKFWENTSRELFKNKFSGISAKLLRDVKNIYLPTTEVFYFDDVKHVLSIEVVDSAKGLIKMTDEYIHNIIAENSEVSVEYKFGISDSHENYTHNIDSCKIDDVDCNEYKKISDNKANRKGTKNILSLKGKTKYAVRRVDISEMCLDDDDIIMFRAPAIMNDLSIHIHHSPEIELDFYPSGTLKFFEIKQNRAQFKEYEYQDIIYPGQGYCFRIKLRRT